MVRNDRSVVHGRHAYTRLLAHGIAGMHPTVDPSRDFTLFAPAEPNSFKPSLRCRTELKPHLRHWSHIGDMHQTGREQNTKMIDFLQLQRRVFPSPIGEIALGTEEHDLVGVCFVGQNHFLGNRPTNRPESVHNRLPVSRPTLSKRTHQRLGNTAKQPAQFIVVMLQAFSGPLAICSGTPFQRAVWTQLLNIAQGIKRSCIELAAALGKLETRRPIEHAVGRNPVGVITPVNTCWEATGNSPATCIAVTANAPC